MSNSRLLSLLSVALLLSYAGNTICTSNDEQQMMNAVIGTIAWGALETANQITDEENSYYNYIHGATKLARSNFAHKFFFGLYGGLGGIKAGSFNEHKIEWLKSTDPDSYGAFEGIAETTGSMVTLFAVKKGCDVSGISKKIEVIGDKMPPAVKFATKTLLDFAIIHIGWNGLAKLVLSRKFGNPIPIPDYNN